MRCTRTGGPRRRTEGRRHLAGAVDRDPRISRPRGSAPAPATGSAAHQTDQSERDRAYESGHGGGPQAIAARPNAPEGHFWLAANMGGYAEDHGIRGGLKYRGDIRASLEKTLALDPAFLQGSADRALGRWDFKVPGLFGGSKKKSEEHLRKALTYNPRSIIAHIFLAETLEALDRKDEAIAELKMVAELATRSRLAAGRRRVQAAGARHAGAAAALADRHYLRSFQPQISTDLARATRESGPIRNCLYSSRGVGAYQTTRPASRRSRDCRTLRVRRRHFICVNLIT